jgi:hypothetical protein
MGGKPLSDRNAEWLWRRPWATVSETSHATDNRSTELLCKKVANPATIPIASGAIHAQRYYSASWRAYFLARTTVRGKNKAAEGKQTIDEIVEDPRRRQLTDYLYALMTKHARS